MQLSLVDLARPEYVTNDTAFSYLTVVAEFNTDYRPLCQASSINEAKEMCEHFSRTMKPLRYMLWASNAEGSQYRIAKFVPTY